MIPLYHYLGAAVHSLAAGWNMPHPQILRRHRAALQSGALGRIVGKPRLRPRAPTRRDYQAMTCKQLDSLLRARQIRGRSKARRKAQKINLLCKCP
jgi:hypothetical protein